MDFTPEERAYIDMKLRLADEIQARNGNKLYTLEEIKEKFSMKNKELKDYRV